MVLFELMGQPFAQVQCSMIHVIQNMFPDSILRDFPQKDTVLSIYSLHNY